MIVIKTDATNYSFKSWAHEQANLGNVLIFKKQQKHTKSLIVTDYLIIKMGSFLAHISPSHDSKIKSWRKAELKSERGRRETLVTWFDDFFIIILLYGVYKGKKEPVII